MNSSQPAPIDIITRMEKLASELSMFFDRERTLPFSTWLSQSGDVFETRVKKYNDELLALLKGRNSDLFAQYRNAILNLNSNKKFLLEFFNKFPQIREFHVNNISFLEKVLGAFKKHEAQKFYSKMHWLFDKERVIAESMGKKGSPAYTAPPFNLGKRREHRLNFARDNWKTTPPASRPPTTERVFLCSRNGDQFEVKSNDFDAVIKGLKEKKLLPSGEEGISKITTIEKYKHYILAYQKEQQEIEKKESFLKAPLMSVPPEVQKKLLFDKLTYALLQAKVSIPEETAYFNRILLLMRQDIIDLNSLKKLEFSEIKRLFDNPFLEEKEGEIKPSPSQGITFLNSDNSDIPFSRELQNFFRYLIEARYFVLFTSGRAHPQLFSQLKEKYLQNHFNLYLKKILKLTWEGFELRLVEHFVAEFHFPPTNDAQAVKNREVISSLGRMRLSETLFAPIRKKILGEIMQHIETKGSQYPIGWGRTKTIITDTGIKKVDVDIAEIWDTLALFGIARNKSHQNEFNLGDFERAHIDAAFLRIVEFVKSTGRPFLRSKELDEFIKNIADLNELLPAQQFQQVYRGP